MKAEKSAATSPTAGIASAILAVLLAAACGAPTTSRDAADARDITAPLIVELQQFLPRHVAKHGRIDVANETRVPAATAIVIDDDLEQVRFRRQVGVAARGAENRVE